MTGSVLAGMKDLVDNCENRFGDLDRKLVLDIGCNDGSLLDFFKEKGCNTVEWIQLMLLKNLSI